MRIILKSLFGQIFLSTCVALVALPVFAAEPEPTSDYRLNVKQESFRLVDPSVPEPPAKKLPPIPPHLVERPYANLIHAAAHDVALDPALVHAVIHVESGYNQKAVSPKGAIGLMQLMPDTARRYGVTNPAKSPEANLRAGTLYLKELMQMFEGRLDLVLAAYNAGEKAVQHYGLRIPPYAETQAYVPAVMAKYREWQEPPPPAPPAGPVYIEYMPGTRLNTQSLQTVR